MAFVSKKDLLDKVKTVEKTKEIPGLGTVKYRNLSFQEQQNILLGTQGQDDYAVKCIVAGFIEPAFTFEDIPALRNGSFGLVSQLAKLPLEDLSQGAVTNDELGNSKKP